MPRRPELQPVQRAVSSGGAERPYLVYDPGSTPTGVVVCLHGRGITAKQAVWLTRMDELATREGAVVVFPQATDETGRAADRWSPERDLPHLAAVIGGVRDEFGDGGRGVCLAGISNGAWMASWYAAARADDVVAVGAVAGLRPPQVAPSRPVPVVAFHGLLDRKTPYELSAAAARAWAAANDVPPEPDEEERSPTLTRTTYGAGTRGEVAFWTFARAGHTWPGSRANGRAVLQLFHGRISLELDATEEIWRFYVSLAGEAPGRG